MRRPLASLVSVLVALAVVSGALGYFAATGAGTATGSITTLSTPGNPAANAAGSGVSVTWTASTINGTVAASSYAVERYDSNGTDLGAASCSPVPSSSGNPNAFGSFSCTDSPGAGTYKYKITARYASWTATTGFTNTVTVLTTTSTSVSAPVTGTTGVAIGASSIASTLSGATSGATGTITFKVFGPQSSAPTTCTSGGTTVGTATVSGNGTYHPGAGFTPGSAGTYWWYASYGGDASNGASNSGCGAGMAATYVYSVTSAASATDTSIGTSTTTSSFTVAPSTTYLLFVFRSSLINDNITSISSTGLTPALSTSSFTSITSQTYNTLDYQWAYWVTTSSSASGTGTLNVSFANANTLTIIDLVKLGGNSTSAPVVTTNVGKATGLSTTVTANLPGAPASSDAGLVFLTANANLGTSPPAASPAMTNVFYSNQLTGSSAVYAGIPAAQNESFSITTPPWGTIALEIAHG